MVVFFFRHKLNHAILIANRYWFIAGYHTGRIDKTTIFLGRYVLSIILENSINTFLRYDTISVKIQMMQESLSVIESKAENNGLRSAIIDSFSSTFNYTLGKTRKIHYPNTECRDERPQTK